MLPPVAWASWLNFLQDLDTQLSNRGSYPGFEPRGVVTAGDLMFCCLVAMAKWPSLVRQAVPLLQGLDCSAATATEWRLFLVRMLEVADGRPYLDDSRARPDGRSSMLCDFVWLCTHVGLVRALGPGEEPEPTAVMYELGLCKQRSLLLPPDDTVRRLCELMETIRSFEVNIPCRRGSEAAPASSQAKSIAVDGQTVGMPETESLVLKVIALSHAVCGTSASSGCGMLARRLLALVEHRMGENVWDGCNMKVLLQASPDLGHHLTCLSSFPAGVVRRRFGMSPLWLPVMTSLWDIVAPDGRQAALRSSYPQVRQAAENCDQVTADPSDWVVHL
jgi:hypothetical protein